MKDLLQRALVIGIAIHKANKVWFANVKNDVKAIMAVTEEQINSFGKVYVEKQGTEFYEILPNNVKTASFKSGKYIFTHDEDGLTRNVVLPTDGESVVVVHDLTITTTDSDLHWQLRASAIASHVKDPEKDFYLRNFPQSLKDVINNSLLVDHYPIFTVGELVLLTPEGLQYLKDNIDSGLADTGDFSILLSECQEGGAKQEHLEAFGFSIQTLQELGYIKDLV